MSAPRGCRTSDWDECHGWLLISTLQHFAYCPNQAALIRDGVWLDNHLTVSGELAHSRVDARGTDRRRGARAHHRVALASGRLGVHGIADTVEEDAQGRLTPVEHKLGRGAGELFPSIVQVVTQALCLEEMTGQVVEQAALFVVEERVREPIEVAKYREEVVALIGRAHAELTSGLGRPSFSSRRCRSCSVLNVCQPRGSRWL